MASSAGTRQSNQSSSSSAASLGRFMVPASKRSHRQNNGLAKAGPDTSVLRPSISVNITGMKQAVKLLESGTPEIRHYLLNECNVIYECKVCFNMFRSLANFIAHKRSYCQSQLKDVRHVYRRDAEETLAVPTEELATAFVQPEPVETIIPDEAWDITNYSPSLELMKDAGLVQEIENRPTVPNLMPKPKPKLDDVVQRLKAQQFQGLHRNYFRDKENHIIQLERLKETTQAMFQTYGDLTTAKMSERYNELQRLKKKPCLFVGPDGKVVDPGPIPSNDCSPNINPPSGFACPLCMKEFEKLNLVYRHLVRTHKKSSLEANNLRKKSKRMALTNSKFRALTPEELLKGEDMELGHPLDMGPSHKSPSKSSISPSSTSTVSSSISPCSSSQTSSPLIFPTLPPNSSSVPTVLTKCSTSPLSPTSKSVKKMAKVMDTKLKQKTIPTNLGTSKKADLVQRIDDSKRTTRTTAKRNETPRVKRLRKGPHILALECGSKKDMKSKLQVDKKTGEDKLKRKCDIQAGTKRSCLAAHSKSKSKPSSRKAVKKNTK
ncbi:zinc finger protein 800-like isoform X2 [Tigriopus californicus]|uniref:zinc finger protein 800-like isoform X2 n=1 Tax=Tigriopus californicus TaxID=6832 RepID=UPI0027D9E4E1|nr:zinc finger protein 800-like isoform X2 [Tigriopus californicus]